MAKTAVNIPTANATGIPVYPSLNNMAVNPNASTDVGNMILIVHEYLIGLSGKIGILKTRPTTMAATSASI